MDDTLTKAGIFQGVEPQAAAALAAQLQTVWFPRSAAIISQGEPGDRLYIILDGKVKIGAHSRGGAENLLAIMGPGDMFGELSVFDPGPRTISATALTDVKAATLDRAAIYGWISQRPEIAQQLLQVMARRLRRTNDSIADLIFTDVPGRIAKALLQMADQFGISVDGQLRLTLDLTQEELAQLVGASRETVNKALADFRHRGWMRLEGNSVFIHDPDRLSRRAR